MFERLNSRPTNNRLNEMRIIRSVAEMQEISGGGFVPTMGALHDGHLSLVRRSVSENPHTTVSIFVNPIQFGPNEDFGRYPRTFEADCKLLETEGVDFVFAPMAEEMTQSTQTRVQVSGISDRFEGPLRPGHFDGVATIVAKLFLITRPQNAYFGLKDLQQCAVIRQMVIDLCYPIRLIFCETLRETSGLAMSSRNRYLSPNEIEIASQIYQQFQEIRKQATSHFNQSNKDLDHVKQLCVESRTILESVGFRVQYLECVDFATMDVPETLHANCYLIFAGFLGKTRLIDNIKIFG